MIIRPCRAAIPRKQRACLSVLAIGALAAGAFGCESAFESALNPSVVSCQVSASMPAQSLAAAGGRGSFQVSALPECAWRVTPSASWISGITPASGQGNEQVTFVAAGNPTPQMRQGEIVINSLRVTVRQEAAPAPAPPPAPPAPTPAPPSPSPPPSPAPTPTCTYVLAAASATVTATGGALAVGLTTGTSCTWTVQSQVSWITVTSLPSGVGPVVVALTVAPNSGGARSGTVSIANQTFTVHQSGTCSYSIKPDQIGIGGSGATGRTVDVTTTAGCPWTAVSNAAWITVTSGASGTGSGVVTFSVAANGTDSRRTGTISIAGETLRVEQNKN